MSESALHRRCFFAPPEQVQGGIVVLPPDETRHLKRVLRLPDGDQVEICDGQGRAYLARILSREDSGARLEIISELPRRGESPLTLTLALGLARADVMDLAVRQATELGVCQILPFISTRSVSRPADGEAKRRRWQRLAQDALKSSQRRLLPRVAAPVAFPEVLPGPESLKIMCWEACRSDAGPDHWQAPQPPASVRLVIGPEGGFTASEAETARAAGYQLWGLGPRRLRVETAALTALTLVQFLWGDLGPTSDLGSLTTAVP